MLSFLNKHPWLYIVFIFVALGGLWAWFITFAVKHKSDEVPLTPAPAIEQPETPAPQS